MGTRKVQTVPVPTANNVNAVLSAMQNVVATITAQSGVAIQPLATTATTAQIIAKINETLARLQGTS